MAADATSGSRAAEGGRMHLAQLNIGRLVADPDSPEVDEFMRSIPAVNNLGEVSPGFVWMLKDEGGEGATGIRFPGHEDDIRLVINLTVWQDLDSLQHFVMRSGHGMYLRRRRDWFEKLDEASTVLWWIPEDHEPTIEEAAERLDVLRSRGPTPAAFDLHRTFPEPH